MSQLLSTKNISIILLALICFSGIACEKTDSTIIDTNGYAPAISNPTFSFSRINTDTINIDTIRSPFDILTIRGIATIRVYHQQGSDAIKSVSCSFYTNSLDTPIKNNLLNDKGEAPDEIPNDSIYSGYAEFQIFRNYVGQIWVKFVASSITNDQSSACFLPLEIVRLNKPPIISNLLAPDTVYPLQEDQFDIFLKVIDPDGQNDIKAVLRFTPSGKILNLYPTQVDSIYSEFVSLEPPPPAGSYTFRFVAVDRSNDSSNFIYKTIVVVQ